MGASMRRAASQFFALLMLRHRAEITGDDAAISPHTSIFAMHCAIARPLATISMPMIFRLYLFYRP